MNKLDVVGTIPEEPRNLRHLTTLYELSQLRFSLLELGHVCWMLKSLCVLSFKAFSGLWLSTYTTRWFTYSDLRLVAKTTFSDLRLVAKNF
jgi:hypothetical protein